MDITIANRLQQLRKDHGFSQEELADRLHISRQAVSKWERSEASPDTDNLIALANLYALSLDELLYGTEGTRPQPEQIEKDTITMTDDEGNRLTFKDGKMHAYDSDGNEVRHKAKTIGIVSGVVTFMTIIAYILLGTLGGWWHPAWIIFFAIPTVASLEEAIEKKDAHKFAYPVLITAVYLLAGTLYGWWHPSWVVFLTIPLYYLITSIGKK